MAKIVIRVIDYKGSEVARKTFKNPPKDASQILDRLSKAGYEGDLLDGEGVSLSGEDQMDDKEEFRLVLLAPPLPGVHCLWQSWREYALLSSGIVPAASLY